MTAKKNLPPEWKVKWQLVTKQMATTWLKRCKTNRKLNESVVESYRRVMDAGLWDSRPSQSPIAIDRDGNCINGQHRLHSFLNSKLESILLPIIVGCDPSDYLLFDQDIYLRSRAAQFTGRVHVNRDMARVRMLETLLKADPRSRVPNALFESLVDKTYSKQIEWAAKEMPRTSDQCRAAYVAAFMYVYGIAPEFVENIARSWVNGAQGLPLAMVRLRDDAIRNKGGGLWQAMFGSLRLLNGLMYLHRKSPVPRSLPNTLTGINYWSNIARDGVAAAWAKNEEQRPTE